MNSLEDGRECVAKRKEAVDWTRGVNMEIVSSQIQNTFWRAWRVLMMDHIEGIKRERMLPLCGE